MPTDGPIFYYQSQPTTKSVDQRIADILASAAANPWWQPPIWAPGYGVHQWRSDPANASSSVLATTDYDQVGPREPLGIAVIDYSDLASIYQARNLLPVTAMHDIPANVLVYVHGGVKVECRNVTAFQMNDAHGHFGLVGVNNGLGSGAKQGKPWFCCDHADMGITTANTITRAALVRNAPHGIIRNIYSSQNREQNADNSPKSWQSKCPVIAFKGATQTQSPRFFLYQQHYNEGSPAGYGNNQFASYFDSLNEDIRSEGGTAMRLEPDTADECGVHRVYNNRIQTTNGNRGVALSPHAMTLEDLYYQNVFTVSAWDGVKFADDNGEGGTIQRVLVEDACISGGLSAQNPFPIAKWTPNQKSDTVINDGRMAKYGPITYRRIGWSGSFTKAKNPSTSGHTCSLSIAQAAAFTSQLTLMPAGVISGSQARGGSFAVSGQAALRVAAIFDEGDADITLPAGVPDTAKWMYVAERDGTINGLVMGVGPNSDHLDPARTFVGDSRNFHLTHFGGGNGANGTGPWFNPTGLTEAGATWLNEQGNVAQPVDWTDFLDDINGVGVAGRKVDPVGNILGGRGKDDTWPGHAAIADWVYGDDGYVDRCVTAWNDEYLMQLPRKTLLRMWHEQGNSVQRTETGDWSDFIASWQKVCIRLRQLGGLAPDKGRVVWCPAAHPNNPGSDMQSFPGTFPTEPGGTDWAGRDIYVETTQTLDEAMEDWYNALNPITGGTHNTDRIPLMANEGGFEPPDPDRIAKFNDFITQMKPGGKYEGMTAFDWWDAGGFELTDEPAGFQVAFTAAVNDPALLPNDILPTSAPHSSVAGGTLVIAGVSTLSPSGVAAGHVVGAARLRRGAEVIDQSGSPSIREMVALSRPSGTMYLSTPTFEVEV